MLKSLTSFVSSSVLRVQAEAYSRKAGSGILRGKYWARNQDGTYKDYNESITILPEEFAEQDEYKKERKINDEYIRRYKKHLQRKEELFSIQLPKEKTKEDTMQYCDYPSDEPTSDDLPKKLDQDPYKKQEHQCIFCQHNIPLDYKNVQLLSQFVSPQTGITYSQQVTGLCYHKYIELENTIIKARRLGLMPFFYKETVFTEQPELFNPGKNVLREIPNNYDKRKFTRDD